MDEAERCSRVGLMFDGNVIVCDTPERIKGLVEGQLLELRPDRLREAAQLITELSGVLEVQTYGDLLHVFVDDAIKRASDIEGMLGEAGIAVEGVRQTRPRMEEAFISLIRKRSEEET
jgi:ABC-2 type transport system ATP-binding protein